MLNPSAAGNRQETSNYHGTPVATRARAQHGS
jgi:hypothetical protein